MSGEGIIGIAEIAAVLGWWVVSVDRPRGTTVVTSSVSRPLTLRAVSTRWTKRMRLIVQRVARAEVRVGEETVGRIGRGALVLAGVLRGDGPEQADLAAEKLAALRFFDDAEGRMNLDAAAADGDFLVVSQFTLAASLGRGRRPSFDAAAPPEEAEPLLERLVNGLRRRGFTAPTGRFRARMDVELVNDGPVTFVLDV